MKSARISSNQGGDPSLANEDWIGVAASWFMFRFETEQPRDAVRPNASHDSRHPQLQTVSPVRADSRAEQKATGFDNEYGALCPCATWYAMLHGENVTLEETPQ